MRWRVEASTGEEATPWMGWRPASTRVGRARTRSLVLGALTALLSVACISLEDSVAELHRLHRVEPADGGSAVDERPGLDTHFDSPAHLASGSSRVRDPLSRCLEHTIRIAKRDADRPRVRARQIETFAWLIHDCSYGLTRERCIRELGRLARRLRVESLELAAESGTTEAALLERGFWLERLPTLEGEDLETAVSNLAAQPLGAEASADLLAASLRRPESRTPPSLVELRDEAARRTLVAALDEATRDPDPRVRAVALRTWGRLGPRAKTRALEVAFEADHLEALRAAADLLASGPVPPPPASVQTASAEGGSSAEAPAADAYWTERLIEALGLVPGGQTGVALCQALSHVTGRPRELHPERWLLWWDADRPDPSSAATPR